MNKRRESFDKRSEEAIELGKKNVEYISKATGWCKHLECKMTSAGMLAEATRLPIGSIKVSCKHAIGSHESMNLPWIVPEFIIENCEGCEYHNPNGQEEWGKKIISDEKSRIKKQEENLEKERSRKQLIRKQLKALPEEKKKDADVTQREIFNLFIGLFSEKKEEREGSLESILNAAEIASDLFSESLIDIIRENISLEGYRSTFLEIVFSLAKSGHSVMKFKNDIEELIVKRKNIELCAGIYLNCSPEYPLKDELIDGLILGQSHVRGLMDRHQNSYPNCTELIIKSYEKAEDQIVDRFRTYLDHKIDGIRINTCVSLIQLQRENPSIGLTLVDNLIDSLDKPITIEYDSADHRIKESLSEAFISNPELVDKKVREKFRQKGDDVKSELIDLYRRLVFKIEKLEIDSSLRETIEEKIYLFTFEAAKDEELDLEIRAEAAEALKRLSTYGGGIVVKNIDSVLGYYALISELKETQEKPKIILPNEEDNPFLKALDKQNQDLIWNRVKSNILGTVKKTAKRYPDSLISTLISTYDKLDSKRQKYFKSAIVSLLGDVGSDYNLRKEVLPFIMKALVDFDSQLIRARALDSLESLFRGAKSNPPKNIIEIVLLHLEDQYVIVHKAAIRCVRNHTYWFEKHLAYEVLLKLLQLLEIYRSKPYDLKEIVKSLLIISNRLDIGRSKCIAETIKCLPTNEYYVDKELIEEILKYLDPKEEEAEFLAPHLVNFLKTYRRDYNSFGIMIEEKIFTWLSELNEDAFLKIEEIVLESGKELTKKDVYTVRYFVAILAAFKCYEKEHQLLKFIIETYKNQTKHDELIGIYKELAQNAKVNAELISNAS